ncbi:MAG TPA: DNA polymerase III subunit [Pirellulales bacterium]|nr:DNA polymerase III subunit [Pirellulales bacterium]
MSWQGIAGHDEIVEQFRRALARGRLASTFLFVGPEGVGKRGFALRLAQCLLCQERPAEQLEPCGQCASCTQVLAGTHPDLLQVAKPRERSEMPVALLIGSGERRMHEGLCHDISLKPFMGGRRIAIIGDADFLNEEGANCLLKTLEEPPPQSVLILIGTSIDRQLPTIRSRAQIIRFQPLAPELLAQLLAEQGLVGDASEAERVAAFSEGSLARAGELSEPAMWSFRGKLLERLAGPTLDGVQLAKFVSAFVDEAGKEAPPRRARARLAVGFVVEFYRQIWRALSGVPLSVDDAELRACVRQTVGRWTAGQEAAGACADRSLEALVHIDRNANQATWIEAWVDDLTRLAS